MTTNYDITLELGSCELVCNVDLSPYDPGISSGPPEACYPAEGGEMDVNSIKLRVKPGDADDCFVEVSDLIAALDSDGRLTALLDAEVEKLAEEPPEPDESGIY